MYSLLFAGVIRPPRSLNAGTPSPAIKTMRCGGMRFEAGQEIHGWLERRVLRLEGRKPVMQPFVPILA
jgi:hypothetical protein